MTTKILSALIPKTTKTIIKCIADTQVIPKIFLYTTKVQGKDKTINPKVVEVTNKLLVSIRTTK